MTWFGRHPGAVPPVVVEWIRPVEVPILTEVKRRLGREDLPGAILYAYPKVVEDLARGYSIEIPPGYSHEEILARCFTEEMLPSAEFFDRLYRIYAPVRYGGRAPPGSAQDLLELLQSLYGAEPMWRLYVAAVAAPANGGTDPPKNGSAAERASGEGSP